MNNFLPHNIGETIALLGAIVAIIKYVSSRFSLALTKNVKQPIDDLTAKLYQMESVTNERLTQHDEEITILKERITHD